MNTLEQKMNDAIWIAKELFDRGKATGSSANLSFLHDGHIYITGSCLLYTSPSPRDCS